MKQGATQGRDPGSRAARGHDVKGYDKGHLAKGARSTNAPSRGGARPPSQRQLRVGEEIRHVLAGVFARGEVRDPELHDVLITVTEVRIGPDLKRATAFVTRLGRSDIDQKLNALRRAAPFLRGEVAKALRLRVAPDLSFQADTSIDYAMEVDRMLRQPEVARDLAASAPAPGPASDEPN